MTPRAPRNTLDRARVLESALALADRDGLESLTIRGLAAELQVRPMAIYHYVASKDELLDELVDIVFGEVHVPSGTDWRAELFRRSSSFRAALVRHPWAVTVVDTRSHPGPTMLANHEAVLEVLRGSGFSVQASGHAYAILDAFVYGFALQEVMLQKAGMLDASPDDVAGMSLDPYPRIAELAAMYMAEPTNPLMVSFDAGLGLVLDGVAHFATAFPQR